VVESSASQGYKGVAAVLAKGETVSSPFEADSYYIMDGSLRAILGGPYELRGSSGLSKLAFLAGSVSGLEYVVVARIGLEGYRFLASFGVKVLVFRGSLGELVSGRGGAPSPVDVEGFDGSCPCCSRRLVGGFNSSF